MANQEAHENTRFTTGDSQLDATLGEQLAEFRANASALTTLAEEQRRLNRKVVQLLDRQRLGWCSFRSTHPKTIKVLPRRQIATIIANVVSPSLFREPSDNHFLYTICPDCLADLRSPTGLFRQQRKRIQIHWIVRQEGEIWWVRKSPRARESFLYQPTHDQLTDRRDVGLLSLLSEMQP